ncbi:hypothetical protein D9613_007114 [Agrocybe pediades]|uniref:Uncharacterized protein n=1 Tax=Agrocybe pediades TaxID=84607 RepID=A0A8H4QHH9_9AGAR|nr:hypothetical protein D9613_007114 [Agrocybe pediades]
MYVTVGPINEKHLERMDSYTQRIRHFIVYLDKENAVKISPHIFMYLSEMRHSRLFPAIKILTIPNLHGVPDLSGLWLIPSSTLTEVNILGIIANGVAETLLDRMSRSSPGIQRISLEGDFDLDPFADVLERFANLKELSLYMGRSRNISAYVLDALSRLDKLQDLRLFMKVDAEFTSSNSKNLYRPRESDNHLCFNSLERFYMTARPQTALDILKHLPALKSMSRFSVYLLTGNYPVAHRFLQNILQICPTTLRHLTLSSDGDAPVALDIGFRNFLDFPFSCLETLDTSEVLQIAFFRLYNRKNRI